MRGNEIMTCLIRPQKLNKGDKVATVSLSWGGAGNDRILWRYLQYKSSCRIWPRRYASTLQWQLWPQ